jgi:hypothetical protein
MGVLLARRSFLYIVCKYVRCRMSDGSNTCFCTVGVVASINMLKEVRFSESLPARVKNRERNRSFFRFDRIKMPPSKIRSNYLKVN